MHRDLKPGNVLFSKNEEDKACVRHVFVGESKLHAASVSMGSTETQAFMALKFEYGVIAFALVQEPKLIDFSHAALVNGDEVSSRYLNKVQLCSVQHSTRQGLCR